MENNRKPTTQMKQGRVRASIWETEGKKGTFETVTFSRAYPAGDGKYKYTSTFSVRDLKLIEELIPKLLSQMKEDEEA